MVEPNGQDVGCRVGHQVHFVVEDLTQQSACVISTRKMFSQQGSQTGLGAVADHLDGIDEMLPLCAQTSEAVLFGQGLHRDVMCGLLALLFEVVNLHIKMLNLFLQLSLLLLISM